MTVGAVSPVTAGWRQMADPGLPGARQRGRGTAADG